MNSLFRNIAPENGKLNLPRLSVCLDPPTSLSRLSKLGISPNSWNSDQLRTDYTGETHWPINSKNNSDLFDKSMYSFDEVFEKIDYFKEIKTVKDKQFYKVRLPFNFNINLPELLPTCLKKENCFCIR